MCLPGWSPLSRDGISSERGISSLPQTTYGTPSCCLWTDGPRAGSLAKFTAVRPSVLRRSSVLASAGPEFPFERCLRCSIGEVLAVPDQEPGAVLRPVSLSGGRLTIVSVRRSIAPGGAEPWRGGGSAEGVKVANRPRTAPRDSVLAGIVIGMQRSSAGLLGVRADASG